MTNRPIHSMEHQPLPYGRGSDLGVFRCDRPPPLQLQAATCRWRRRFRLRAYYAETFFPFTVTFSSVSPWTFSVTAGLAAFSKVQFFSRMLDMGAFLKPRIDHALSHLPTSRFSTSTSRTDRKSTRLNSSHLGISY